MKYILVVWYMITPPIGDSIPVPTPDSLPPMPGLHGAAIEPLDYQKTIVILGRYDSRDECIEDVDRVSHHISNLDPRRSIADPGFDCVVDPKG